MQAGQMERKRSEVSRKLALSMLVLALLGSVAGYGTWSAFSATTDNTGNSFAAGTVVIDDDDADGAMFSLSGMKPSDPTTTKCIEVTYSGSLPSSVTLYGTSAGTGLDAYLTLKVTRGEGAVFGDCAGFDADDTDYLGLGDGVLHDGSLTSYPDGFGGGITDPDASWASGESAVYMFEITLQNDNSAQGLNATQAFTWEARNL